MKILPSDFSAPAIFAASLLFAVLPLFAAAPVNSPKPAPPAAPAPPPGLPGADIARRLAQWKPVAMPFDASRLSERERQLLSKLVDACRDLEAIYWQQSDPQGLALWKSLAGRADKASQDERRLLWIMGGRYDLVDENRRFVGLEPMPPGRALYPPGTTREQIEKWVQAHPDQKGAIYDEHTVVVRAMPDGFAALPYRIAYRRHLEPAAEKLRAAADLSEDAAFAKFLRLRADALLTDDYFASDLAWLDLENPKFDLILAPYETYLDGVLGVKTSYGAAVLVRNEVESKKLEVFQKYIPDLQDALPLAPEDRPSKHGRAAPMEVMDAPFRAGDLRHGYQAAADNLPNDPRVHEQKGSKRIFFKNYMDVRVEHVILPVAKLLMRPDQAARVSGEGYLAAVMMHEISHGLGAAYARMGSQKVSIREAIGPVFGGLEEAKADVTGMWGLAWLAERGALPRERLPEYYASYLAGIFRTVRFGTAEAHGRAEMMEFNYLSEKGAITRDPASGRYTLEEPKMRSALAELAQKLLQFEAAGDRAGAEAWFAKYDPMPEQLKRDLERAHDVPVDIDPQLAFPERAE